MKGVKLWVDTGSVFGKFSARTVERQQHFTDAQWEKHLAREIKKLEKELDRRKGMKYRISQQVIGSLLMIMAGLSGCSQQPQRIPASALKTTSASSACSVEMVTTPWFNTASNCASQPEIDRVFNGQRLVWNGRAYVVVIHGNEITIYDQTMKPVASSRFRVRPAGDVDYNLMNVAVCDDCRFGVASYKNQKIYFDLGGGSAPAFVTHRAASEWEVYGAFTWKVGGTQYLAVESEFCEGTSGQYHYNSVGDLTFDECLPVGNIVSGIDIRTSYYMVDKSTQVYIYDWIDGKLKYQTAPFESYGIRFPAMALDHNMLAVANRHGLALYDVSTSNVPDLLSNTPGDWNRVGYRDGIAVVSKQGFVGTEQWFDARIPHNVKPFTGVADEYACSKPLGFVGLDSGFALMRWSNGRIAVPTCPPLPTPTPEPDVLFEDGFESGDTTMWTVPL